MQRAFHLQSCGKVKCNIQYIASEIYNKSIEEKLKATIGIIHSLDSVSNKIERRKQLKKLSKQIEKLSKELFDNKRTRELLNCTLSECKEEHKEVIKLFIDNIKDTTLMNEFRKMLEADQIDTTVYL